MNQEERILVNKYLNIPVLVQHVEHTYGSLWAWRLALGFGDLYVLV
jgi:hypothetical protein